MVQQPKNINAMFISRSNFDIEATRSCHADVHDTMFLVSLSIFIFNYVCCMATFITKHNFI